MTTDMASAERPLDAPSVAVILISHNGQRWLPAVLGALPAAVTHVPAGDVGDEPPGDALLAADDDSALWAAVAAPAASPLPPGRIVQVAVDTGSDDASAQMLRDAGFETLEAAPATPFGRAVAVAVSHIAEHHPDIEWLWLLHDDSAPESAALAHLLAMAVHERADVVGPKVHSWSGPRLILERGIRLSGSGRRYYGVDKGELDQGQYDHIGGEEVLAVGSAGMLVSVRAWNALNGFDPALPASGDDIDFCRRARRAGYRVLLCTGAAVRHARAMSQGRRRGAISEHPGADARYASMVVLLAHARGWLVWWYLARLTAGSWVRAAAYLLQRDIRGSRDQLEALTRLYAHPSRVRLSRSRAAAAGPAPRDERALFMPVKSQVRALWQSVAGLIERVTAVPDDADTAIFLPEQDGEETVTRRRNILGRVLHRPLALITAVAAVVAAAHGWGILVSSAPLTGGRLGDTSISSWALIQSYASGWHDIGRGVTTASPPWMLALGVLGIPFLGHVSGFLAFIIVFFVPLMVLATATALRRIVSSTWVSAVVALVVALSPVFTTAAQRGDVATLIIALLAPFAVRLAVRAIRQESWSSTIGSAMLLAVIASFSPLAWLQMLGIAAIALVIVPATRRQRQAWLRWAGAAAGSVVLLLPWPLTMVARPWAALVDAGLPDADVAAHGWAFLGLSSHGARWWTIGILVAAALAATRAVARPAVASVWLMLLAPVCVWLVGSRISLAITGVADPVHPSVQSAVALIALGAGCCIALACDGLLAEIRHRDLGLVHISAAVAALAVGLSAGPMALSYLTTSDNQVVRGRILNVPEFVAIDMQRAARPRALVLEADAPNPLRFHVAATPTRRIGNADILRAAPADSQLADAVTTLVSPAEPYAGARLRAVRLLSNAAVKYIVLPSHGAGADDIATAVAASPGLKSLTTAGEQQPNWVWRVSAFAGRAMFTPLGGAAAKPLPAFAYGSGPGALDAVARGKKPVLNPGAVRIADATSGWRADVDGTAVDVTSASDGTRTFEIRSAVRSSLHVSRDDALRRWSLAGHALAWIVALILALPTRRSADIDDGEVDA